MSTANETAKAAGAARAAKSPATSMSDRLLWGSLGLALLLPAVLFLRGLGDGSLRARSAPSAPLADYGVVPDFSLVERSGRTITRDALAGTPWLADFVYTDCSSACPLLSAEMAKLSKRAGDRVRLVSFSVDPANDTPAALTEYAERFGAPADRWLFLTGEPPAMKALVSKGFHLAIVDPPAGNAPPGMEIAHSEKIVLVDRDFHIRRYYDGTDPAWIGQALADLRALDAIGGTAS